LDLSIGSYAAIAWKFQGNVSFPVQKTAFVPKYGTRKQDLAEVIRMTTISQSSLSSYVAKLKLLFSPTSIASGETLSLGGLIFTANTTVTQSELAALWAGIADADTPATLNDNVEKNTMGAWSGNSLNSFYTEPYDTTSTIFLSTGQAGNIAVIGISGTGALPVSTVLTTNALPAVSKESNLDFTKVVAPNANGYTYTRFQRSQSEGWDKQADPSDVTITILEDSANAEYIPEKNIGKHHRFDLYYGSDQSNRRVKVLMSDLVLSKVTPGTEGNSRSSDLALRNVGTTEVLFS
jgi:hypothetical protein